MQTIDKLSPRQRRKYLNIICAISVYYFYLTVDGNGYSKKHKSELDLEYFFKLRQTPIQVQKQSASFYGKRRLLKGLNLKFLISTGNFSYLKIVQWLNAYKQVAIRRWPWILHMV